MTETGSRDLIAALDEASLSRFHLRAVLASGMGFFADAGALGQRPVGETFGRATAFLEVAGANASSISETSAISFTHVSWTPP